MNKISIDFQNLHLIHPNLAYINSYRAAIAEYRRHGVEDFAYPTVATRRDAVKYLRRLERYRRGIHMPGGYVPSSAFWLVDGRNYLGSGDIRHFLDDNLRRLGGHIGYSIRPGAWRQGLGTVQLALLLKEAGQLGIPKAIVTCYDTNIASAKVIEKNGGVLIKKISNTFGEIERLTRIYEIDLTGRN